ncbi:MULTISPECIES: DUF2834 domain-containing protein [Streptomyces]|uniref:DUF2834 domain-containing protein n=1 Tax=Streptomyces TaxID=1883 RepID=UPI00068CF1C9|nr:MULTISPECIES: DUF2834 domain-containing protein [Streptomyces]RPK89888.1 hypothetical protein EES46_14580 [Streptomyces sp. ADI98-10]
MPPSDLSGQDRALCLTYGLFALGGGLVMGAQAVAFVVRESDAGPLGIVRNFLRDATVNAATVFVYADLVLVWAALAVFMIVEGRRHGIAHVWAYIVGAPALALVASFCAFMYVRQLKIAAARGSGTEAAPPGHRTPTRGRQR